MPQREPSDNEDCQRGRPEEEEDKGLSGRGSIQWDSNGSEGDQKVPSERPLYTKSWTLKSVGITGGVV